MKLSPARTAAFLRDPGTTRVVLLYGDNLGLIRERGQALIRAVLGAADDPFRLVRVEEAREIAIEAREVSLGGGRRIVRVPDAGEAAREPIADVLASPTDALVVLEAPGLTPSRSRLFKLVESAAQAVAIPCYAPRSETFPASVRRWLKERDVAIDEDALLWIQGRLGADTALDRAEIEKLALYVGAGGTVDLAAARASVGDAAGLALEDALFAATEGAIATADRALERALAEGTTSVAVIRAALSHLERLERAALAVRGGASRSEATKAARVFFRHAPAFTRALALWPPEALRAALRAFAEGERTAKRTGVPAAILCRHLLSTLAMRAKEEASGQRVP